MRRCRSAPLVIAPRLYQPCAPLVGRQTSPSASAACLTSQRCRSFRHATTPIPGIVAASGYHDTGGDAPGSAQAGQGSAADSRDRLSRPPTSLRRAFRRGGISANQRHPSRSRTKPRLPTAQNFDENYRPPHHGQSSGGSPACVFIFRCLSQRLPDSRPEAAGLPDYQGHLRTLSVAGSSTLSRQ